MHSTIEKQFLEQLKRLQVEYAVETLTKPNDKSEFGFGQVCGVYRGLLRAEQLFKKVIGEDDDQA